MANRPARSDHMTARARSLRRTSTEPEQKLWSLLRDRRLDGAKFRRQHSVGNYVADFCCVAHKLIIEIDGASHEKTQESDATRTVDLEAIGFRVIRVGNEDVMTNPEGVLIFIARSCEIDISKWQSVNS